MGEAREARNRAQPDGIRRQYTTQAAFYSKRFTPMEHGSRREEDAENEPNRRPNCPSCTPGEAPKRDVEASGKPDPSHQKGVKQISETGIIIIGCVFGIIFVVMIVLIFVNYARQRAARKKLGIHSHPAVLVTRAPDKTTD